MVSKRRRSDADSKPKVSPLSREDATTAPTASVLEQSEVAFPRGGASALSALELKEVANEAARDVLFENENSTSKPETAQRPSKKKKLAKSVKSAADEEKIDVPIETLNFKRLMAGTLVLGQIIEINRMDIVLALPDNLVGYIPITSVSSVLTKALEELDDSDEQESDDEDEESTNKITSGTTKTKTIPSLSNMFKIGQWLRAIVLESVSVANKKKNQKKRIQLSIEPEKVNKTLEDEDLTTNTTIQVTVKAVEDHGAILDTGKEIGGFVSKKEIKAAGFDPENITVGAVFLATISNKNARTITVKLTANKKSPITTISSVEAIIPGNFIETLVTDVKEEGLITRAYGMIDATINLAHLGVYDLSELKHRYAMGSKIRARVIAVVLASDSKKLVLSVLPNVINMNLDTSEDALTAFPIGHVFESVSIKGMDSNYIYASIDSDRSGQIHLSRLDSDSSNLKVFYAPGSQHKARVLGYSQMDHQYTLTLDPKVINQKYLRAQDIPVGELVTGQVLSVSESGLQIKIFDKFEAHVAPMHLSDVKLIYPERKFKIGSKVKGRVLSISKFKSEINVTLKKSLVGVENVITSFDSMKVGDRTSASVFAFKPSGAIVSFFGNVKAFLPKAEISETFVRKPEDHLRLGQTITVRVTSVDTETKRATVSCRLSEESSDAQKKALTELVVGRSVVKARVMEKTKDSVVVELPGSNLRGVIFEGHLSDGNFEQNRALLKRTVVGSTIEGLILDKDSRSRIFNMTAKKSLIASAEADVFPVKFKDIKSGDSLIAGYVKSVTNKGVFVGFGSKLVGLILAKYATERPVDDLTSVFYVNQSVSVRVLRVDEENKRFLLTLKEKRSGVSDAVNPVDSSIKSLNDLVPGRVTKALIKSVKQTQLNVQLADNIQGRVDISQIFDDYSDIKDPQHPLSQFSKGDLIDVKVIGFHDARNHRFLPISHKKSKDTILELTAKRSDITQEFEPLSLDKVSVGSESVVFINNSTRGFYFVSLSPTVRGRISLMDISDDATVLDNVDTAFPVGCALKAKVKAVDAEHNSVLLTARENNISSIKDVKKGMVLPARVVRISENFVVVELAEGVTAISFITDALDDYTKKLEDAFTKNDICAASVLDVDVDNKKIHVSLRTAAAKDKLVSSSSDVKRADIVRGFVKNISDKGLFVSIGRTVTAYVKVSNLSDSYIKDFKKFYKLHQPVIGKIVSSDDQGNVSMTLKESEVNGELNILKRYEDLSVGDIFEGSVKRVTDFGVFVKLDGTLNITGLCHHSQISDNQVSNVSALFGEGDRVKVKLLAVDTEKKQLSLGMKASYFEDDVEMEDADVSEDASVAADEDSIAEDDHEDADEDDEDEEELAFSGAENESESDDEDSDDDDDEESSPSGLGLGTNGFDWTAQVLDVAQGEESSDDEDEFDSIRSKKKKRSKTIVEDTTGDINADEPQSASDFERLLIGNPNSSLVWMKYMAFQLGLSEYEKAREIGERALKTINYREEQEKLNIWVGLLNLENTFGTDDSLEEVFNRSIQYMEPLVMHQRLITIYTLSEKFDKAEQLFKVMVKKFGKSSVSAWVQYGSFLLDRGQSEKAREILGSALTSLPKRDHIEAVRRFAQNEFTKGDPEQGRTLFEGLLADVPKRIDLWSVYIDQEIKAGEKKKVEELFERVFTRKLSRKHAKFFFDKWLKFEEKEGDSKACDYVKAKAQEYVQNNK